jgi:DNA-binding SARP family transcriptional activator
MDECRLLLLGPPRLISKAHDGPLALRKAVALAAYLAVERRAFSRDYLATLLWPDHNQQTALANLRKTLSFLKSTFTDGCLCAEGDQVALDPDHVRTDIDDFRAVVHSRQSTDLSELMDAWRLYRGSFLEGFSLRRCDEFDHWQSVVREQLEVDLASLLERACRASIDAGTPESALPLAHHVLEVDPWNERGHRFLMEVLAEAGHAHAARDHFEAYSRTLAESGLEPEDETRALYDEIGGNGLRRANMDDRGDSGASADSARGSAQRSSWVMRHRWPVIIITIVAAAMTLVSVFLVGPKPELTLTWIEAYRDDMSLVSVRAGVAISSRRVFRPIIRIVFSTIGSEGLPRDYVVYQNQLGRIKKDQGVYEILAVPDIRAFVEAHGVPVPPGSYRLSVELDPEDEIDEESELDNRLVATDWFYYGGAPGMETFEVDVEYEGELPLNATNPLKVFIGDRSLAGAASDWGWFLVTREGTHHFPLADIKRPDTDGSGYFMLVIHDRRNDLRGPYDTDHDDLPALFKPGVGNLAYGEFSLATGTPVYPGKPVAVRFARPDRPKRDPFEPDNGPESATLVDPTDGPIRQYHTLHADGTGDRDIDWFAVPIPARQTLTIETFSADHNWECNTQIDISDPNGYVGTNRSKSETSIYSRISYDNPGSDPVTVHASVRAIDRFEPQLTMVGEYVVELRYD